MISFFMANISYAACGLNGSVAERIQDCSHEEGATLVDLALVSRDQDQNEIYKNMKTGLIWGSPLASVVNYAEAKNLCAQFTGLGVKNWKLPSLNDFDSLGLFEPLPNMKDIYYWTSTPLPRGGAEPQPDSEVKYQMIVNGSYTHEMISMLRTFKGIAVRCVTQ